MMSALYQIRGRCAAALKAGSLTAVREILSIPDGYMPLNVIPVGYPAENPPAKDKWNPAKIHYDKW